MLVRFLGLNGVKFKALFDAQCGNHWRQTND
jgi:hypothetical protein